MWDQEKKKFKTGDTTAYLDIEGHGPIKSQKKKLRWCRGKRQTDRETERERQKKKKRLREKHRETQRG